MLQTQNHKVLLNKEMNSHSAQVKLGMVCQATHSPFVQQNLSACSVPGPALGVVAADNEHSHCLKGPQQAEDGDKLLLYM